MLFNIGWQFVTGTGISDLESVLMHRKNVSQGCEAAVLPPSIGAQPSGVESFPIADLGQKLRESKPKCGVDLFNS